MHRLLLLLIALHALPCASQENPSGQVDYGEESGLLFEQGKKAYDRHDYLSAIEAFIESHRLAPNININLNLADVLEMSGQYDQAIHHYYDVLHSHPDLRTEAAAKAGIALLKKQCALIHITSKPEHAAIYFDRKELGIQGYTPHILAQPEGIHQIWVEHQDYRPSEPKNIELKKGQTVEFHADLELIGTRILIHGKPEGAAVYVGSEEQPVCTLPCDFQLPVGVHLFRAEHPRYFPFNWSYAGEENQTQTFNIALEPKLGQLVVDSDFYKTHVEIDGVDYGETPLYVDAISDGPHHLKFTHPDAEDLETDIEISYQTTNEVHPSMKMKPDVDIVTPYDEHLPDLSSSISLISKREIHYFGYQTVYDAVLGARGFYSNTEPHMSSLGVRGIALSDENRRLFVARNGHRMNNAITGGSPVDSLLMATLSDVERIELFRGPASSVFLGNGITGAINVIQREDQDLPRPQLEAAATKDSSLHFRGAGSYQWSPEGGFWLSADMTNDKGHDWSFHRRYNHDSYHSHDHDRSSTQSITLRAWQGHLSFFGHYLHNWHEIPIDFTGMALYGDSYKQKYDRAYADLQYDLKLSPNWQLKSHLSGDLTSILNQSILPGEDSPHEDQKAQSIEAALHFDLFGHTDDNRLKMQLGLEIRQDLWEQFEQTGLDRDRQSLHTEGTQTSAYARAEYWFWEQLALAAQMQLNLFEDADATWAPQVSLLYRLSPKNRIKLFYEQAYRAPSLMERYSLFNERVELQKASLKNERASKLELEYSHQLTERWSLLSSLYVNSFEQLILFDTSGRFNAQYYQNQSKDLYSLGGEIAIERNWADSSFLQVRYSIQRSWWGNAFIDNNLYNSPLHLACLKIAFPLRHAGMMVANRLRIESERYNPGAPETESAYLWDLTITSERPLAGLIDYAIGFNNLLDWRASIPAQSNLDPLESPQLGRTIFMRFRLQY